MGSLRVPVPPMAGGRRAMSDDLRKAARELLAQYDLMGSYEAVGNLTDEIEALRAALAAPPPEPTYHLSTQEQQAFTRALVRSTKRIDSTPESNREPTQDVRMQFETWCMASGYCGPGASSSEWYWIIWQAAHAAGFEAGRKAGGRDGERWREVINHVGAERTNNGRDQRFTLTYLYWPHNLMKGSVAEHFTRCIDAAIDRAMQEGKA